MAEKKDDTTTLTIKPSSEPLGRTAFDVVLEEYCQRLSAGDGRVEMISAFHAEEKSAGRVKDSEGNYRKRFDAFCTRPVKD